MMNVLVWSTVLQKTIPGIIRPNFIDQCISTGNRIFYTRISYDFTKFVEYSVTREEVYRYFSETVLLREIYPVNTQAEIQYYNNENIILE